jgi:nitrite reductase/ring-hydroxylating ferredoxin subunit
MFSDKEIPQFEAAAQVSDIKDGTVFPVHLKGTDLLLARVGQNYYAVENHCPHSGAEISHGTLDGSILTCPLHGSKFDLIDGKVIRHWTSIKASASKLFSPIQPLKTYPVKIEKEKILVKIDRTKDYFEGVSWIRSNQNHRQ